VIDTDLPTWATDPCPPDPLVLAHQLGLPPGSPVPAPRLVGDVHVTVPVASPGHRALAVAMSTQAGHGVLVRATAAWVWTGDAALLPRRTDLALPPEGPVLPGPRPAADRAALAVRLARWPPGSSWTVLAGVALTDPATTAGDCARLLPPALAARCLRALARGPGFDAVGVAHALAQGPSRPGRRQALALLREVRT